MFFYPSRQAAPPVELQGQFTPDEAARITRLHQRFHTNPICFKFDINYRRLEFARWLVDHGYLSEWYDTGDSGTPVADTSADQVGEAANPEYQKYPHWRCA